MDKGLYQHDVIGSIVAYKTNPAELEQAIRSFVNTTLRVKMLVVDNSPTETLGPMCRQLGTDYLYTGKNRGFGAGHNLAIRKTSTAKYHLVLNPDVQFEPKALEELVAFLDLNESVGLVMPRVSYPDGSPQKLCKRLPFHSTCYPDEPFPVYSSACVTAGWVCLSCPISTPTSCSRCLSFRPFHVAAQEIAAGMWSLRRTILHVL